MGFDINSTENSFPTSSGTQHPAYDLPLLRAILNERPLNEELLRKEWLTQISYAERRFDLVVFQILLSLLERTGGFFSPPTKALFMRYHGVFQLLKCQFEQAEFYLTQADKIATEFDNEQLPLILADLGEVYIQQGQQEDATVALMRALYFAKKFRDSLSLTRVYSEIATLAYYKGDLEGTLHNGEIALEHAKAAQDNRAEGAAYNVMAAYYLHRRDWVKCFELFNKSLELCQKAGDLVGQAETHSNMGAAARYKGDLQEALFNNDCAITICQKIRYKTGLASALDNQSHVLNLLNRSSEALPLVQQSLDIRRDTGDRRGEVISLTKLALTYRKLRDFTRSSHYLEAARALAEEMQERVSLMMIYTELGELNLENFGQNGDRHRLGLYYFHQAFDLMTITGDRNLLLDTTERLATATLKCGCAECQDEALQAYQKLLELLGDNLREGLIDEKSTKLERARLVGGIARCYQLKGHTGIALDYFRHTFSLLDGSLSAALEKKDFDAGLLYCYAAQCAVDAGNYEDAFTWYEKGFPLLRSGHQDFLSLRAVLANHP